MPLARRCFHSALSDTCAAPIKPGTWQVWHNGLNTFLPDGTALPEEVVSPAVVVCGCLVATSVTRRYYWIGTFLNGLSSLCARPVVIRTRSDNNVRQESDQRDTAQRYDNNAARFNKSLISLISAHKVRTRLYYGLANRTRISWLITMP